MSFLSSNMGRGMQKAYSSQQKEIKHITTPEIIYNIKITGKPILYKEDSFMNEWLIPVKMIKIVDGVENIKYGYILRSGNKSKYIIKDIMQDIKRCFLFADNIFYEGEELSEIYKAIKKRMNEWKKEEKKRY